MAIKLYGHNQTAYDKAIKMLNEKGKCCIIHPTGTGKSYIALKWLNENKHKKSLFVTSSLSIIAQLERTIRENGMSLEKDFPNLKITTYSSLMKDPYQRYDNIVLDEFHRAGAEKWGEGVKQLLNFNPSSKVLGLSATPVRYLDSKRDMSEELFDGNVASHITLPAAIAKGILPPPTYINAIYSFKEDLERIESKVEKIKDATRRKELEEELKNARRLVAQADNLPDIFEKYMKKKDGKYIVFCKDINHLKEMMKECPKWFKRINEKIDISYIHSEEEQEMNKYTLERFHNVNGKGIKLLFCVGMLNEGVHVEDIDGVIMLRPTSSPILYMQQFGRGLTTGDRKHPLIFDIVNNIKCLKDIKILKETVIKIMKKDGKTKEEIERMVRSFNIIDDYKNISQLLEELDIKATYGWEENYEVVAEFTKANERFPTKSEPGGIWLNNQRQFLKEGKLSEERKAKLDLLGDWNKSNDDKWEENYEVVAEFKQANGRFPTISEPGGKWLSTQRTALKNGSLKEERKAKLDLLGNWNKSYDDKWNENYEVVAEFTKANERFPTISEPGGQWLGTQRTALKNKTLKEERKARLDLLGDWNKSYNDKWDENYEFIAKFKNVNGRFPKYNEPGGQWLHDQKKALKNGSLKEERKAKLDLLGYWNRSFDNKWNENYEFIAEFKQTNGRFPTISEPGGKWFSNQRTALKNGKLKEERKAKLDLLGNWQSARQKPISIKNKPEIEEIISGKNNKVKPKEKK